MYEVKCSRFFPCFCKCCNARKIASEVYEPEVKRLERVFLVEKSRTLEHPLSKVFVTFDSLQDAREVLYTLEVHMTMYQNVLPARSTSDKNVNRSPRATADNLGLVLLVRIPFTAKSSKILQADPNFDKNVNKSARPKAAHSGLA